MHPMLISMNLEIRKLILSRDLRPDDPFYRNGEEEQTDATKIIEAAKALGQVGGATLIENLLDLDFDAPSPSAPAIPGKTNQLLDLMSMDAPLPPASTGAVSAEATFTQPQSLFLSAESTQGLEINGGMALRYVCPRPLLVY